MVRGEVERENTGSWENQVTEDASADGVTASFKYDDKPEVGQKV